jgi:hypothetical protein
MIRSDPPQPSVNDRVHKDMAAAMALEQDAELMLRVRDGDSASFGLLLERHRRSVIHFVYRIVLNQAIAEELAQEVSFAFTGREHGMNRRRSSRRGCSGSRRIWP